ncbi:MULTISPECIES: hypothetical protein [Cyanophyceae]|uniref:hypothetical protein n=1 Tax=Cyanophyceae TaxID=3028117 RepID=UPI0016863B8F|nr:hypothetical protein [Trichocoleus sp. FACHB-40]MBD2001710.1 hypothetical protein [Trichocoleus sp. FACHB-40]
MQVNLRETFLLLIGSSTYENNYAVSDRCRLYQSLLRAVENLRSSHSELLMVS